jgi:hypothetical protein
MEAFKVEVPQGYEIDKENSTLELIRFKPKEKQLPKAWWELGKIAGYYVNANSHVTSLSTEEVSNPNRNTFCTEAEAEAAIALAQLAQLRKVYRNGWEPDYLTTDRIYCKYCIFITGTQFEIETYFNLNHFLSFQSREIAEEFLTNFKDLILKAKPLMS